MKTVTTQLAAHLAGEVTTLATCWKITRTDETVLGFTDHDTDLVVDSLTFHAASGFTPAALASADNMSADKLSLQGVLSSDFITEEDMLAGRYDFAGVEIFQVNYADITQGKLILRTGWLGEVKKGSERFEAEMSGLASRLAKTLGQIYSPLCRVKLGDAQCGVDMTDFTRTGTVTSVTDRRVFKDSARTEAAGFFTYGTITFTDGLNDGLTMEVKDFRSSVIELVLPMPFTVQAGDTYILKAGCDKTFATCKAAFSNALNFRGEPHVPGTDKMLETSSTRSSLSS